jgi:hypothetical protein
MEYCSCDTGKIYQTAPKYSGEGGYLPKGWTECIEGYIREADQWAKCINRNRRKQGIQYTWVVHLNHNEELPPAVVTSIWSRACNILRKRGVVCLWVREPNRRNKVHYHIIVSSPISQSELKQAIEDAMPLRSQYKWRKRVEYIKSQYRLAHYVVKAKIKGFKNGKYVNDLYRPKRLLFNQNIGFKKVGVIGDFWGGVGSKKKMWKEIQNIEERIAEGLNDPLIKKAAKYVFDICGDLRYCPLRHIERSFGYNPNDESVKGWIEQMLSEEKSSHLCTSQVIAPQYVTYC